MKGYPNLLSPLNIGGAVVKNRMVYPNASPHFLQGPETYPAESYIAFMAGLAKNGAGIVTIAEWEHREDMRKMDPNMDMSHMQGFDVSDPSAHNYLSAMADAVHFYGSKLLISTRVAFPPGYSLNGGRGFAPMPGGGGGETKPATREIIAQAIDGFIETCRFYKNLGYDGVTMRVDMALQPSENERDDEYGGSAVNRARYIIEAYARVKDELGCDFITEAQLAGEQPMGYSGGMSGNGYTLEDTIAFAKAAEGCIDILQLREKDMCKSHPTGFTYQKGEHDTIRYSEAIKAAGCGILTEPIGGFQDPEELEGYIAAGKCDMIGMARAFMADPLYGEKLYEGRGEDVTPCLWCNKCHGEIKTPHVPWISVCSVNPKMGIEHRLPWLVEPSRAAKRVAVIGGGPAGMRAAIYAAELGHSVKLYEKSDRLGGQIIHGDYFSFKWPIGQYKQWLIRQLAANGVEVVMNTAPTPEMIKAGGFDAVIAATGAVANIPAGISGIANPDDTLKSGYMTCIDTFGREAELGKKVVIVGGSETGIETAMYLADNGHDVTLLTRQGEIGHDCSKLHYITMAFVKAGPDGMGHMAPAWEAYDNIHGIVNVTTKSVDGGRVTYADKDGVEGSIEADSVVICGGTNALVEEAMAFQGCAPRFFVIGDANGAGNLQVCNREAYSRAQMI